jgi:hypothetical protein
MQRSAAKPHLGKFQMDLLPPPPPSPEPQGGDATASVFCSSCREVCSSPLLFLLDSVQGRGESFLHIVIAAAVVDRDHIKSVIFFCFTPALCLKSHPKRFWFSRNAAKVWEQGEEGEWWSWLRNPWYNPKRRTPLGAKGWGALETEITKNLAASSSGFYY